VGLTGQPQRPAQQRFRLDNRRKENSMISDHRERVVSQEAAVSRKAWQATFDRDPINLRRLPTRTLVRKARAILDQIAAGVPYTRFRGKRFRYDRTIISVPLGRRYRLLFQDEGGALHPLCCLSHEAYNHWRPRG
jgi:hypothetical protein